MVADLELPPAVFKTCPWQPRELIEAGLRQWLRCCGPALWDNQVIGMPSRAVDEAWHGLILCTARYSAFCASVWKSHGASIRRVSRRSRTPSPVRAARSSRWRR
jgi:hypothetical protein